MQSRARGGDVTSGNNITFEFQGQCVESQPRLLEPRTSCHIEFAAELEIYPRLGKPADADECTAATSIVIFCLAQLKEGNVNLNVVALVPILTKELVAAAADRRMRLDDE